MFGKLNLKVVHGGDASLNSIKVMQPKQVRNVNHIQVSNFSKIQTTVLQQSVLPRLTCRNNEHYNPLR